MSESKGYSQLDASAMKEPSVVDSITLEEAQSMHRDAENWLWVKNRKWVVISLILLLVWLNLGSLFYGYYYGWPYTDSLYYAAQAGLSIGFGALAETSNTSRLYTIFHVMCGSSFIAGAVGLFVTNTLEANSVDWKAEREKKIAKLLGVEREEEPSQLSWSQEHATAIRCVVASILWGTVGVLYGVFVENWSFITSLYFCVTACSTAGLQAPTVNLGTNSWNTAYVAIFVVVGVPVYGLVLGQFANLTIEEYMTNKRHMKVNKHMTEAQIKFAMAYNGTPDGAVDWDEFLCFSLIRLGIADIELLEDIKHQFHDLDVDHSGYLDKDELTAAMEFGRYDVGRNGRQNASDFKLMFTDLCHGRFKNIPALSDERAAGRAFDDMDGLEDGERDQHITRKEFQAFFNFVSAENEKDAKTNWFAVNSEEWLAGTVKLPLKPIPVKVSSPAIGKNVLLKKSEIVHFYKWCQSAEGKQFIEAHSNMDEVTELPEAAFLHNKSSGDTPALQVSSPPVKVPDNLPANWTPAENV